MAYKKGSWWISYTVKDAQGYPVQGFNSKGTAIKEAKKIKGAVVRNAQKLDKSYEEETTIFSA